MEIDETAFWKDNIDWEATYEKNIDHFWNWAIDKGFCEDYVLDNQSELEDMWVEYLEDKDIVWEKANETGDKK